MIRLCLRVSVEPLFIPKRRPEHNGSVEQFNGWFQPVLLNRPYRRPADLRRELQRLMTSVNEQHVHPQLGKRTSAQYRWSQRLRKLPADLTMNGHQLPIAVGKVSFIRLASPQGTINILKQPYQVGKRLKFQYVKATIFTRERTMKVYYRGRVVKDLPYQLTVQ